MALGKPSIPVLREVEIRAVQGALSAISERLRLIEAQLATTAAVAGNTSVTNSQVNATVNALQAQVARLAATVAALVSSSILTLRADAAIAQYDPVWFSSDGGVSPVNLGDPEAIYGVIGIATAAATSGANVTVQVGGVLAVVGAVFTPGGPVFADIGGLTQFPSYTNLVVPIGVAAGVSSVGIMPSWPVLLQPGVYATYEDFLPVTYRLARDAIEVIGALLTQPDGIVVLSAGTLITREIVSLSGSGITVTDGDGVLGNPTINTP